MNCILLLCRKLSSLSWTVPFWFICKCFTSFPLNGRSVLSERFRLLKSTARVWNLVTLFAGNFSNHLIFISRKLEYQKLRVSSLFFPPKFSNPTRSEFRTRKGQQSIQSNNTNLVIARANRAPTNNKRVTESRGYDLVNREQYSIFTKEKNYFDDKCKNNIQREVVPMQCLEIEIKCQRSPQNIRDDRNTICQLVQNKFWVRKYTVLNW